MARPESISRHSGGRAFAWSAGAVLLALGLAALLVFVIWRSGLLAARPDIAALKAPSLPAPIAPAPNPEPLPAPGPGPR